MTWVNLTDAEVDVIADSAFAFGVRRHTTGVVLARLNDRILEARAETLAHAKQIEAAREHCDASWDSTVEVDIEPPVSPSETGVWVGAWVWVPNEE